MPLKTINTSLKLSIAKKHEGGEKLTKNEYNAKQTNKRTG
jgi:hypothetical protein